MPFGGPTVVLATPFLEAGTWYVEVKGGGTTDYRLTSNPVLLQRPAWAMPAFGVPVTTPGLPPGGSLFADTGVGTNGVALPGDQGTDPGTYTLTIPTVRPNTPLYLGFRAAGGDASFTVGLSVSPQNIDVTNVVAFYGGSKTVTLPAGGVTKFRVPVPAEPTSWRHASTHASAVQVYRDQGTLPDLGLPSARMHEGPGARASRPLWSF